jgi:hypothetical protein
VGLYLFNKFILRIQKTQTMMISFAKILDAACGGQLFECSKDFRRKLFELFEQNACYAIGDFKFTPVFADKLEHEPIRRQVTLVGDLSADFSIFMLVEIKIAVVKDSIMP